MDWCFPWKPNNWFVTNSQVFWNLKVHSRFHNRLPLAPVLAKWIMQRIESYPICVTNYMEQDSSWEADICSCVQEILRILWNPKPHYRIHKSPPSAPYPEPDQPTPSFPFHFLKLHFNVILPSTAGSSKCPPSLGSSLQNPVCMSPLPHLCYMLFPSRPWFYHQNDIWWGVQSIKLLVM